MASTTKLAAERAIRMMHENLGDYFTIDDMANSAMFSKFHFTRIFQEVTGVSPGRFLSALRLQKAKQLLVSTRWNVADISVLVGYSSVGTFSTRFSKSVGLSPSHYRRHNNVIPHVLFDNPSSDRAAGTITGRLRYDPPAARSHTFVGAFPKRILEGRPVSFTFVESGDSYVLPNVPEGEWYVLACTGPQPRRSVDAYAEWGQAGAVGTHGLVSVQSGAVAEADIWLRPRCLLDPPVLLMLFDEHPPSATPERFNRPLSPAAYRTTARLRSA